MGYLSVIQTIVENKVMDMHTAFLGKVLTYQDETATIQPLLSTKEKNEEAQPAAILLRVPVCRHARPLETGHLVCCICGERDITEARRGDIPTSSPTGHHSMSDAIVVGVL